MKKTILFIIIFITAGLLSCYDGLLETRNKTYKLRDMGPAGGLIFYINPDYEKDGWRYLEAAPLSTESPAWWSNDIATNHNTKTEIGTGQANTSVVVAWLNANGELGRAAQVCDSLNYGGYSDWFLPSKDELELMCWNLKGIRYNSIDPLTPIVNPNVPSGGVGNFSDVYYWCSFDFITDASCQYFSNGDQTSAGKQANHRVRAIRAF